MVGRRLLFGPFLRFLMFRGLNEMRNTDRRNELRAAGTGLVRGTLLSYVLGFRRSPRVYI